MSIFSIVVARKGSKGLKNKVVRKIADRYVFEYSIEYSLELAEQNLGKVYTVVSSDSKIIEKYCYENNIKFIRRRSNLASDTTPIEDVILDAYESIGKEFTYISLVYGNIPIRYVDEFSKAFDFFSKKF